MKHVGNLEITEKNQEQFLNLKEVTGDVSVYSTTKLDALTTVGGGVYVHSAAKLDAPLLTTVGGALIVYSTAKLDAPLLTTVGGGVSVHGTAKLDAPNISNRNSDKAKLIAKTALAKAFKKHKLLKIDEILSFLISIKVIKYLKVFKVRIVGKLEISFIVQKDKVCSHGKTLKEAKASLKYKLSDRDTTKYKKWKLTETKSIANLISAYRAITGACEFGTKQFCESQNLKKKYTINEVIKLTDGKFGAEQFAKFFNNS